MDDRGFQIPCPICRGFGAVHCCEGERPAPDPLVDRDCAVLDGKCDCQGIGHCKYLRGPE